MICSVCKHDLPEWALKDGVCGNCHNDDNRTSVAKWEAESRLPKSSWNSDYGIELKTERNRLLDSVRWTIMPDTPLSTACQAAFKAYMTTLQQMTLTTPTTTWVWPTVPKLEYPSVITTPTGTKISVVNGVATVSLSK